MVVFIAPTTSGLSYNADSTKGLVMHGVTVSNTTGHAIWSQAGVAGTRTEVFGAVHGNENGINLGSTDDPGGSPDSLGGHTVFVAPGAVVSGGGIGVTMLGVSNDFNNAGTVTGFTAGVSITGLGAGLHNSGLIESDWSGPGIQIDARGSATATFVENSGRIAGNTAISNTGSGGALAVVNSGALVGDFAAIYDVGGALPVSIVNTGEIVGSSYALYLLASAGNDSLVNHGLIRGGSGLGDGNNYVHNQGTIAGNLAFGIGNDVVVNDGDLHGLVALSAGNDRYSGAGTVSGAVMGDQGDDVFLIRGGGAGVINGGPGLDRLTTWADLASVEDVEDIRLRGSAGCEVRADLGANRIRGSAGDDLIWGGTDDDTLNGRGGDDVLVGGAGRDLLRGGRGSDAFAFTALADTGATAATRDQVLDFTRGEDLIDLEEMTAGAFAFRGTKAFTATGGPELRLTDAGANVLVHLDYDGDGVADTRILVLGVDTLSAGDFVL